MKLTIKNLQYGDFGNYRCISKNSLGETEGSIRVYGKCMELFLHISFLFLSPFLSLLIYVIITLRIYYDVWARIIVIFVHVENGRAKYDEQTRKRLLEEEDRNY